MANNPNLPPSRGGGPDYNTQFGRMNINASSFVPNPQVPAFIPRVGHSGMPNNYPPQYGYPMHAHPQMYMYGAPPGRPMGMHPNRVGQGHYGMQPPFPNSAIPSQQGMAPGHPKSMKPVPVSSLETDQQTQRHHQSTTTHDSFTNEEEKATQLRTEQTTLSKVVDDLQDDPVDSWEERVENDSLDTSPAAVKTEVSPEVSAALVPPAIAMTSGAQNTKVEREVQLDSQVERNISVGNLDKSKTINSSASGSPSSGCSNRDKSRGSKSDVVGMTIKQSASQIQAAPKPKDDKENVNIIFIGHVDAGKSTIGGHLMYLTGQVDKRTLEKYEREAKEKNRETWYLSWALDTNQEERDKGKTVEVGRAAFETAKKRFTILDAPGHAGFVPNMISGAAQADIGVLVISARKGEFETGFEKKGQTREHAMLAKTAGVKHLVVLINKMDDPTVGWDEQRYEECLTKLTPFLKKVGFNPKTDLFFIPVSGLTGLNLKDCISADVCPWYSGPPFISYLDDLPPLTREDSGPFRMPISDKYKDMGTVVMGKVESGAVTKGVSLLLMPNRMSVEVLSVMRGDDGEILAGYSGDSIKLKVKGVEEEDLTTGFVLCDPVSPCHVGRLFDAQIVVLEHKSIICAGYSAVLHIHSVVEEVQIIQLKALIDRKTGKKIPQRPRFVKQDQIVLATLQTAGIICLENFQDFPQMARFTLRDEGKTIAIGKVLKLIQ